MANEDFWQSILNIIHQGFTQNGLSKLEEYAENFISQQLIYKRFSPSEQHGCIEGGTNHVIASLLAGAEVEPDKLSAPKGSFKIEMKPSTILFAALLCSLFHANAQSQQAVRVVEFCPAPGQVVNTLPAIAGTMTKEERLQACEEQLQDGNPISLGAAGG